MRKIKLKLVDIKACPTSQKTASVSSGMNAKSFLLRRDLAPDEALGEETPGVLRQAQDGEHSRTISPRELHINVGIKH